MSVARAVCAVSREERVRAEVEEWEEPLHPGPVSAFYPTFPHNARRLAHFLPLISTIPPRIAPESGQEQPFPERDRARRREGRRRKTPCGSRPCKRPCAPGALPSEACAFGGDGWDVRPPT